MRVREVMTAAPMTIDPEAPVETAEAMKARCMNVSHMILLFSYCRGFMNTCCR